MQAKGYSLVFVPSGAIYKKLSKIISNLCAEYNAPRFKPHVTILPQVITPKKDISKKSLILAKSIKPFKISLTNIGYGSKYFTCVFVNVKKSKQLMNINSLARKMLDRMNDSPYMPHLSLIYGNYPTKIKKEIREKLGKSLNMDFIAHKISIWQTIGPVEKWKTLKEISFKIN